MCDRLNAPILNNVFDGRRRQSVNRACYGNGVFNFTNGVGGSSWRPDTVDSIIQSSKYETYPIRTAKIIPVIKTISAPPYIPQTRTQIFFYRFSEKSVKYVCIYAVRVWKHIKKALLFLHGSDSTKGAIKHRQMWLHAARMASAWIAAPARKRKRKPATQIWRPTGRTSNAPELMTTDLTRNVN